MPEYLGQFRRMLVYRGAGLGRFHCTYIYIRTLPVKVKIIYTLCMYILSDCTVFIVEMFICIILGISQRLSMIQNYH